MPFATYQEASNRGGWCTWCAKSPYPSPPIKGVMTEDEAYSLGYRPRPRKNLNNYVLVPTSYNKGFKGSASKTYYSVWGKEND